MSSHPTHPSFFKVKCTTSTWEVVHCWTSEETECVYHYLVSNLEFFSSNGVLVIIMFSSALVVLSAFIGASWCTDDLSFPPGFRFGAASAAYQVEGGWNVSDKGENIWDHFSHKVPSPIADGSTGDVACDSYHLWRRDVEMASELGLHFYRFSISWSRLLPTGFSNYISEDGKNYYNNLINALLEKGIEPLVTLYHFDLPQSLQDLGGWANPLIADWFADYARVVYTLYADRVKTWITINEPLGICDGGYGGFLAPAFQDPDIGIYLCSKHTVLAHAKAWRIYDEEFKPRYHGKMTLTNLFLWFEPTEGDDRELTDLMLEYTEGRFIHPIYSKEGGWPKNLEKVLQANSMKRGFPRFRLPPFTEEEIKLVKGTYDYYALNHYTTYQARRAKAGETVGQWPFDGLPELDAVIVRNPQWETAAPYWFAIYPEGLRHQLSWVKENYGDLEIIIAENGYPGSDPKLNDLERLAYIRDNLAQILLAIKEDGVNVTGYTVWTLMDNYEWMAGYTLQFGMYQVDFNSTMRTRKPRASAAFYSSVIKAHSLNVNVPV